MTAAGVTGRSLGDALAWTSQGTEVFLHCLGGLDDAALAEPSELPGWSRAQLVAHVAGNAEALGNLVLWARTGVERPMYASAQQRAEGVAAGARLPVAELRKWASASADALMTSMLGLDRTSWERRVRTAHGRELPATEVPWLRAREVWVHAVDLGAGLHFADLPRDFIESLVADICAKRGLSMPPPGPLPEVAAYLAGRAHGLVGVDELGPWL